jgi:small subunit ribosomal protein S16
MQRTGRKGHAMFRVVVQEARRTPSSGKVIAYLGSYDPHTKVATLEKEKATQFLNNGAQPSARAAILLKKEGVKLPAWVKLPDQRKGEIRNADKLRRNRPAEAAAAEEPAAEAAEAPAEEAEEAAPAPEAEAEAPAEAPAEQSAEA